MEEIQNNSSYYFSTNVSSSTIRNSLSSDYTIIANSYIEFANILINICFEMSFLVNMTLLFKLIYCVINIVLSYYL